MYFLSNRNGTPFQHISLLLDFLTHFQEQFVYKSQGLPVSCKWLQTFQKNLLPFFWTYTLNQWRTQEFFSGGSANSVEDRGQREQGSGDGNPLVSGCSTQFANE
jgi:hypothetical protein